jgi:hypothetical protein
MTGELRETTHEVIVFESLHGSKELCILDKGNPLFVVGHIWPANAMRAETLVLTYAGVGWVSATGMRFTKESKQ